MFHRPRTEVAAEQAKAESGAETENNENKTEAAAAKAETTHEKKEKEEKTMTNEQTESRDSETTGTGHFQRPPHMQRSVPGAFPGAGYVAPSSVASPYERTAAADQRRLVIGPGITMSGEIEACDTLVVEGTLEAALKGAKVLEIAESGTFYGNVEIEQATVAGRYEGELTVNGRLTIKAGGSVTGTIAYKELAVEAGATLDGKISPLSAAGAAKSEGKSSSKGMAPRNDNSGRNGGSELPFAGNAAAAE